MISLVIATYNRAGQLKRTLESVEAQTLPHELWECVVVDNNSTDPTPRTVADFGVRYVFESRQGLSFARNAGIEAARGDVIVIIDDDEWIEPQFLQAYSSFFEQHPDAAAAGGPIVAEYPDGRPEWMSRWTERPIANPMYFGSNERKFPKGRIPGGGNMAIRRAALDRIGLFDTALGRTGTQLLGGEESDLFDRLAKAGLSVWYVPQAVMHHIIPARKTTPEYFRALALNTGRSQRLRARSRIVLILKEAAKWLVTLGLSPFLIRRKKALWLLRLRAGITRGIAGRIRD